MFDSRNKGARYMLDVCRLLSHWFANTAEDARADQLAFRPRSTALMPVDGHWKGKGDILSRPDLRFPLCIECKKHEAGDLDGLFDAPKWPVWKWWDQAKAQASANLDPDQFTPALIFCRNRRENRVLLPRYAARCLEITPHAGPLIDLTRPDGFEELTLCLLDDLLAIPSSNAWRLQNRALVEEAMRPGRSSMERWLSKDSPKSTGSRSRKRTRSG